MKQKGNGSIKSFAELTDYLKSDFDRFIQNDISYKKDYLKSKGLIYGGEYLGKYNPETNLVRITGKRNPFTDAPLEGRFDDQSISFNQETRVVVQLLTGQMKGEARSPENIFFFKLVGVVSKSDPAKLRNQIIKLNERVKSLTAENKELTGIAEELKAKTTQLIALRKNHAFLREELSRSDNYVNSLTKKNQQLESSLNKLARERNDLNSINKDLQNKADAWRNYYRASYENWIQEILQKRRITALLHVTDLRNLESILEDGILPRSESEEWAYINDPNRYDNQLDCVSLSVGRMNYYYFQEVVRRSDEDVTFICLYIDTSILLDDNEKYYCPHNAATYAIRKNIQNADYLDSYDFERMFADRVIVPSKRSHYRKNYFSQDWPTSVQAEILYEGSIPTDKILKVAFPSQFDLEQASSLLEEYDLEGFVDPDLLFIS